MRRKTGAFDRENEILRRLVVPAPVARRFLGAVESAVDLDRGQRTAGKMKLLRLRHPLRVEDTAPRRKNPATDPHANLWTFVHRRVSTGSSIKDGVSSA